MSWADCFETPPKPTQRRVCFPRLKPGRCEIDLEAGTVRAAGVKCKDDDVVTVEEQNHWCPPIVVDSQYFPIAAHAVDQPDAHIGDTVKQVVDAVDTDVEDLINGDCGAMMNTDGDEMVHPLIVPPPSLPSFQSRRADQPGGRRDDEH